MPLHFRLVTPERILADEEILSVSLPTVDGEVTLLPHHVPLAALLVPGIIKVRRGGKQEEDIAVSGGFIHIEQDGKATVLAETAELGHELDLSVIEEAKKRAEDVMKRAVSADDVSFAAAAAALERELARYKVALKHRHGVKGVPVSEQVTIKQDEA